MKLYIKTLIWLRKIILFASFAVGAVILLGYDYYPALLSENTEMWLWKINSIAIFLVMLIRPLADMLPKLKWLRALVPMRKELGILSAMIVLGFGLAKYNFWGWDYFVQTYFSLGYWPFPEAKFWGRLGELVAVPLLLTSNLWSQKKLKKHWKTIQRLAYVYFFAGGYYVLVTFNATEEIWFMGIVIALTMAAWAKKRWKLY